MHQTASTVRTLHREIVVGRHETTADAMRRIDRAETDAVCRHLLGDLGAVAEHSSWPATADRGRR